MEDVTSMELDEVELDRRPPEEPGPPRRGLPGGPFAALALLVVGLAAVAFLVLRRAGPSPSPVATSTPTPVASGPAAPSASLPPLDESDGLVRELARGLSTHPQLAAWLATPGLVRTLTVVVDNVASGETPAPHLRFLAPKTGFRARESGRRLVPDPRGFAGYDAFADAVGALDAAGCARVYQQLAPLFETAYRELGHPQGGFPAALERAIAALLQAPVPPADVPLVRHATVFEYADPKLEALTPAQRQFLRLGPRNVGLIQSKLRELARALGVPDERRGRPPA
jgi:hypothetical protein